MNFLRSGSNDDKGTDMKEKGIMKESEAEASSRELLKIYDTTIAEKLMQKLLPMIETCAERPIPEKLSSQ